MNWRYPKSAFPIGNSREGQRDTATLNRKGQVTIPSAIRRGLGLKHGDQIEFNLLSNGSAAMRVKRGTLGDFIGVLQKPKQALSVKIMNAGIAHTMRSKHAIRESRGPDALCT
jgi:AbrB family looped-hinge helix DNA binding protein